MPCRYCQYRNERNEARAQVATLTAENAELREKLDAIAIDAVSNAARVVVKDREISEHVLRADSLRAEINRLNEEIEAILEES